jgi:NAD(P)-dependent dehydrogenase (short-subunit alcohol dehydrogenase family)
VLPVVFDVADPVGAAVGVAKVLRHFGRIDVLVNNAALHGAGWTGPCLDLAPEQWSRLMAVNVLGIVNVTRAAAGVVINISSMTAYGHGLSSGYAVTKAAVDGLTTSLAKELGRQGVRVVGVAPGFIATDTVLAALPPDRPDAIMRLQSLRVRGNRRGYRRGDRVPGIPWSPTYRGPDGSGRRRDHPATVTGPASPDSPEGSGRA